jgi:radical SAM superfamily enzyme YgiQ (UPF0313 family)
MKIVLVRPPFYALFGLTIPKMKTYPLNLLYLATYVRDRGGHQAAVVDGESISVPGLAPPDHAGTDPENVMHAGIPAMIRLLEDPDHDFWVELERAVLAEAPDMVGITCNSGNMDTVRLMVRRLKQSGVPVILGGSHPTVLPEQSILYTGADMVAMGEGEITLTAVMDAPAGPIPLPEIPSLARRVNGKVAVNPRGSVIPHVDDIPVPDRNFVDRADYFGEVLLTGRGCPFRCAYCASRNLWGRNVRLRSVPSIIEELKMLAEAADRDDRSNRGNGNEDPRPGRWVVKIVDDTFTVSRKRTMKLLDEIISCGLNRFEFTGGVRADSLDEGLVEKMALAGFRRVTLGVESGSPEILRMVHKGETNEDVIRAIRLLRAGGIRSHAFFMIGFPGEKPEDIELSKKLILDARPDHVEINMVTPYPGTEIFDRLMPEDPMEIDRWYRWFHQGMSTHSDRLGYDLDRAYEDFLKFAAEYHQSRAEPQPDPEAKTSP